MCSQKGVVHHGAGSNRWAIWHLPIRTSKLSLATHRGSSGDAGRRLRSAPTGVLLRPYHRELSTAPVEIVNAAMKGIGAERVLFGSSLYRPEAKAYGPLSQHFVFQQRYTLNTIANADLTEGERAPILYRRLFKLDAWFTPVLRLR
jgi:hypothetical protein